MNERTAAQAHCVGEFLLLIFGYLPSMMLYAAMILILSFNVTQGNFTIFLGRSFYIGQH